MTQFQVTVNYPSGAQAKLGVEACDPIQASEIAAARLREVPDGTTFSVEPIYPRGQRGVTVEPD